MDPAPISAFRVSVKHSFIAAGTAKGLAIARPSDVPSLVMFGWKALWPH